MKGNAGNRSPNRYTGGRPPSAYIERRGEIAVKISHETRMAIELIAVLRGLDPRDLVAALVEAERRKELADAPLE